MYENLFLVHYAHMQLEQLERLHSEIPPLPHDYPY